MSCANGFFMAVVPFCSLLAHRAEAGSPVWVSEHTKLTPAGLIQLIILTTLDGGGRMYF